MILPFQFYVFNASKLLSLSGPQTLSTVYATAKGGSGEYNNAEEVWRFIAHVLGFLSTIEFIINSYKILPSKVSV